MIKKAFEAVIQDRMLFVLSAVSGAMVFLMAQGVGFTMGPDGDEYLTAAFELFNPRKYGNPTDYIAPFYPAFLRLLFAMGGGWAFRIFHHFLPAFAVPLIVYFSLKSFSRSAAFLAGLFIALDVNSMFHFTTICSEGPYILGLSLVLFSFCRLLQNPQNPWWAYGHGLSIAALALIRAAGRYLFFALLPLDVLTFRSWAILRRMCVGFFAFLIVVSLMLTSVPFLKFPNMLVPLTFLRSGGMVHPDNVPLHRLADLTEQAYFEHPLPEKGRQLFWEDMLKGEGEATGMMLYLCWLEHSDEFNRLVNASLGEAVRGLSKDNLIKIKKIYKKGMKFHSEVVPVSMIYPNLFSYDGKRVAEDTKQSITARLTRYADRYGAPVRSSLAAKFYQKYCQIDYSDFYRDQPRPWATRWLVRISIIFPFFVSRWVCFLAVIVMMLTGGREGLSKYRLVVVFGMILYLCNFTMTMLFGPHERYRAPMDMFYFLPAAWLYAFLIFDKNWKNPWKWIGVGLLPVFVWLNFLLCSPEITNYVMDNPFLRFGS